MGIEENAAVCINDTDPEEDQVFLVFKATDHGVIIGG
jgi:hypothetical protein